MYDKDLVRQRFLEEVERLVTEGIARSYSKLAEGAGLQAWHISDVRTQRTELTLNILTSFVTAYRKYGVSYGYILDGQREKAVIPHAVIKQVEKAKAELEEAFSLLTAASKN